MSRRSADEVFMARCLTLARRAEGRTAPNPMVGCVVVGAGGRVLAEGWHRRAGEAHAEAAALAKLGGRAPGATLYVNLEPCRHRGRTPPCAPLVAAAGLRRVVIGMDDPVPGHGGGGAWLARRGLAVTRGVLGAECARLNRAFVTWATAGRPLFVLKAGITLDGRVATRGGQSRWITGVEARRAAHRLRDRLDAVLVGIGTVLADDPRLTVRDLRGGRDPVRVVVDSRLRTPPRAALLPAAGGSAARTIIAATAAAPDVRERRLVAAGAEVWRLPARRGRVDVRRLATRLAREGIMSVLVEGGPAVHESLLAAGLADELVLYVAPLAVGGPAPGWLGGPGVARLAAAHRFALVGAPRRLGDDLELVLRPQGGEDPAMLASAASK